MFNKLTIIYEKILRKLLQNKLCVIVTIIVMLILSPVTVITGLVKHEFMPAPNPSKLIVQTVSSITNTIEKTDNTALEIENILSGLSVKEDITSVITSVGQIKRNKDKLAADNYTEYSINLISSDKRKNSIPEIKNRIKKVLESRRDIISYNIVTESKQSLSAKDIELRINGRDLKELEEQAIYIKNVLSEIPGVINIADSFGKRKNKIKIIPDPDKLILYNLSIKDILNTARVAYNGKVVSKFIENNKEYDILISFKHDQINSLDKLKNLKIRSNTGKFIFLKDICSFTEEKSFFCYSQIQWEANCSCNC